MNKQTKKYCPYLVWCVAHFFVQWPPFCRQTQHNTIVFQLIDEQMMCANANLYDLFTHIMSIFIFFIFSCWCLLLLCVHVLLLMWTTNFCQIFGNMNNTGFFGIKCTYIYIAYRMVTITHCHSRWLSPLAYPSIYAAIYELKHNWQELFRDFILIFLSLKI